MATTYKELQSFLDQGGFRYSFTAEGHILTGLGEMEFYRDVDQKARLGVLMILEEGGSYLKMICPRLYVYDGKRHAGDVFQSFLMLNYWTHLIQFEYDDRDGEFRASIELPLEDGNLTYNQLARCLSSLAYLIDRIDPLVRKTLREGGIHIPHKSIQH